MAFIGCGEGFTSSIEALISTIYVYLTYLEIGRAWPSEIELFLLNYFDFTLSDTFSSENDSDSFISITFSGTDSIDSATFASFFSVLFDIYYD